MPLVCEADVEGRACGQPVAEFAMAVESLDSLTLSIEAILSILVVEQYEVQVYVAVAEAAEKEILTAKTSRFQNVAKSRSLSETLSLQRRHSGVWYGAQSKRN
jgi:uncharacterized Fe-S cluster-containing protein